MFVQVIEGRTSDPERLHDRLDVWEEELRPGAIGYLGSAGGCTADGSCIMIVRFESRETAERNAKRPEQTEWWLETERCFDGPVRFHDSEDVHVMTHGRLDDAHFIQVMEGHVTDRAQADRLEQESDGPLAELRPELLGSIVAYFDDGEYADVAYFTSEEDAREGEKKEIPSEMAEQFGAWERVMKVERYLDLTEPWLIRS
jgi:hypothetical protein